MKRLDRNPELREQIDAAVLLLKEVEPSSEGVLSACISQRELDFHLDMYARRHKINFHSLNKGTKQ